jgi:hypothetical protein
MKGGFQKTEANIYSNPAVGHDSLRRKLFVGEEASESGLQKVFADLERSRSNLERSKSNLEDYFPNLEKSKSNLENHFPSLEKWVSGAALGGENGLKGCNNGLLAKFGLGS